MSSWVFRRPADAPQRRPAAWLPASLPQPGTLDLSPFDFGAFVGATVGSLGRDDLVDYRVEVFAHAATLGNPLWTSGALTTSSVGKLPNPSSATFVIGTRYTLVGTRQSDFEKFIFSLVAT